MKWYKTKTNDCSKVILYVNERQNNTAALLLMLCLFMFRVPECFVL